MSDYFVQVIVNPTAGHGKGELIEKKIRNRLQEAFGSSVRISITGFQGEAGMITRRSIMEGAKLIIAVGGDGTLHEVVNGFYQNGILVNENCELGIINCGSGAGFANSIGLPESAESQIEVILNSSGWWANLGRISWSSASGEQHSELFISECQIGIGSLVASRVGHFHKMLGGKVGFGISAVVQAIQMKAPGMVIGIDDETARPDRYIGIVVGNGSECAGGMKLTPDAKPDDGYFDVLFIKNMGIIKRLMNLGKVYSGSHIKNPGFRIIRCKSITVGTDPGFPFEADGEMLGKTPFRIDMVERGIKIRATSPEKKLSR